MRKMLLAIPILSFPLPLFASAREPVAQEKIPVLLISGANNHDWEWTAPSLAGILEESGRFDVTTTLEPGKMLADPAAIAGFRAFVLDYNGPRWGEAAEQAFLEAVRGGTGVTIIHAADNAFPGWVEYERLVGLLWREGTGHGKFHPFTVKIRDRYHPITRSMKKLKKHPDELYHRLVHMHEAEFRVLATAFSDPATGGTGEDEPMITVARYGAGRVFHTPLGHVWKDSDAQHASHEDPQFRDLVARGTEWAATGRVTERLFDGETTKGWRGHGRKAFPAKGWVVKEGCLVHEKGGGGGDIVTEGIYGDFELDFEWKVAPGANSGVKYHVVEREGQTAALGLEFQILDDEAHKDATSSVTSAGALYGLVAPEGKELAPVGTFNRSRIVVSGGRVEHWLNGKRILAVDMESDDWKARIAASKYEKMPSFGAQAGHIAFQDHGDEVWYRKIEIRAAGIDARVFNGEGLEGWKVLGDAIYEVDAGAILGRVGSGGQSFLVTERTFGDFILDVDVKTEERGNSGIQVRSHVNDKGQVFGYQIEIDPSPRAWSGGLYEEGRRGWLESLEGNEAGRKAFRHNEWNHYQVQCIGDRTRVWVNGVQTVDYTDADAAAAIPGMIGLQVHSGNNTRVRWRGMRVIDLDE